MRKQPGVVSRRKPNFDRLEERALLSSGNPGPPGVGPLFAPPAPKPVYSQPPHFNPPGAEGGQGYQGGWTESPGGSMSSPFPVSTEPQPNESTDPQPTTWTAPEPANPTQPQPSSVAPSLPAGTTQPAPDVDTPSGPALTAPDSTVVGPVIPSGIFLQSRAELAPGAGSPLNLGSAPGSSLTALSRGPSGAADTEPAGPVAVDAPGTGATAATGKELGEASGGESILSTGPAASAPPAQPLSLLGAENGTATRLLAPGEASGLENWLTGIGPGRRATTASDWSGFTNRGRQGTFRANEALTGQTAASLDEVPGPGSADLIAHALPFDRAALDRAIDQFFHEFDDLRLGQMVGPRPARVVLYGLALASAFAALEVVRRRRRQTNARGNVRIRHPLTMAAPIGFPELPGSWTSRLP